MLSRFCLSLIIAPSAMLLCLLSQQLKVSLAMGPWDILFRQYCSVHTLHSLGCCQASHLYCVRLLWVYCELRISLDELLENFQHVLYDYSEMSKISFVEPLH